MAHTGRSAKLYWRRLTILLATIYYSMLLYLPMMAVIADPMDVSSSLLSDPTPVRLLMPVVINDRPTPTLSYPLPLITEVLYNPAGSEPDGEWIEIYNAGGVTLNLFGYKIGDQATPGCCEGMLAFPAGATLQPGEVIVVANNALAFRSLYGFSPDYEMESSDPSVPLLSRYYPWAERSVELTNSGDELLLLDDNNRVVDMLSWGSSSIGFIPPIANVPEGYSLERYPAHVDTDSALDWRGQIIPQPGTVDLSIPTPIPTPIPPPTFPLPIKPPLIPTPFGGKFLLSEFMADPEIEPDQEWIEIFNAGHFELLLQDFKIGDEEAAGGSEGMLRFPSGSVLPPGKTVVIANRALAFYNQYGRYPDFEIYNTSPVVPEMQAFPAWGTMSLNLGNSGDELLLLDGRNEIIDSISYGSSTIILNPSIPAAFSNSSLERYPADQDNDLASDWRAQSEPNPGNPAFPTPEPVPLPTPQPTLVINEIHISPDPGIGDANGDAVIGPYEDQFVEIVNMTGSTVNLGGWSLEDALLKRHVFPSPTLLENECAIVIFGGGAPMGDFGGSLVQIAESGTLFLSYPSDSIRIFDGADNLVLTLNYNTEGVLGQSITRDPDVSGVSFIPHTTAPNAGGAIFSPGKMLDGNPFSGCSLERVVEFVSKLR